MSPDPLKTGRIFTDVAADEIRVQKRKVEALENEVNQRKRIIKLLEQPHG